MGVPLKTACCRSTGLSRPACLLGVFLTCCVGNAGADIPAASVHFENLTEAAGLARYTPSFSVAVTDLDNDGVDDLFVGHHGFPPAIYLNRQGNFIDASEVLPIDKRDDRHGYTFVDFDNDGDRDFVYAAGGADGIGPGSSNEVYRNMLVETQALAFVNVSADSNISYPKSRSRHFFPVANSAGDKVDLYLTALHARRPDSANLYMANSSTREKIRFSVAENSSLQLPLESDGKDVFFDFDRDGHVDFLHIGQLRARLYKNYRGKFRHLPSSLDEAKGVISAVPADLNGDGFLDLYLGSTSGHTFSDNVSHNSDEIHFSISNRGDDAFDGMTFKTAQRRLRINFVEHIPSLGKARVDPSDIYIGAKAVNPPSRRGQIGQEQAAGKPAQMDKPGTYLWYEQASGLWHVRWQYAEDHESQSKGIIYSRGIELVEKQALEILPPREMRDYILINEGGTGWRMLELDLLKHNQWTNDLTAADFNNDGLVDIVGLRTRDDANDNGNPFILLNRGKLEFTMQEILQNTEDDIFRADLVVHGFFNDDGLPDIFFTNGYGLLPSHVGPYQYWLNTSDNRNDYLLLELEGSSSNRDAIGAQVEVRDADKKLLGYRELGTNYGRGQDTHKLHFGLGEQRGPFYIRIRWPGNSVPQELLVGTGGRFHIRQK